MYSKSVDVAAISFVVCWGFVNYTVCVVSVEQTPSMAGILIMMPCITHFLTLDKRQALVILHFVTYIQYKELQMFEEQLLEHTDDSPINQAYMRSIVKNNALAFYAFNIYALVMVFLYDANR